MNCYVLCMPVSIILNQLAKNTMPVMMKLKYGIEIVDTPYKTSMIGAGFQPTFYQFAETVIEVKMAISMSQESSSEKHTTSTENTKKKSFWRSKSTARTSTVDATYSSKYNYSAEGSSLLRTRLVPVPPNTIIAQVIDMRNQAMNKIFELESQRVTNAIEAANKAMEQTPPVVSADGSV